MKVPVTIITHINNELSKLSYNILFFYT